MRSLMLVVVPVSWVRHEQLVGLPHRQGSKLLMGVCKMAFAVSVSNSLLRSSLRSTDHSPGKWVDQLFLIPLVHWPVFESAILLQCPVVFKNMNTSPVNNGPNSTAKQVGFTSMDTSPEGWAMVSDGGLYRYCLLKSTWPWESSPIEHSCYW